MNTLVSELIATTRQSVAELSARINDIKQGPIEGDVETFTFTLDGRTYKGRLLGRNRSLRLGFGLDADRAIACRALLDNQTSQIKP